MTRPKSKGFVAYNTRNKGERLFADEKGIWWSDLAKAKVYPTEREAILFVQRNKTIASGYEPYEVAAARGKATAR